MPRAGVAIPNLVAGVVRLAEHLVHHVFKGSVAGEDAGVATSFDQPPRLCTAPELDGDGQPLGPWPPGQMPPTTSLRSGCAVPCGRRLHFDVPPLESGGWNVRSVVVAGCHGPVVPGESFRLQGAATAPPLRYGLVSVWRRRSAAAPLLRTLSLLEPDPRQDERLDDVEREERDLGVHSPDPRTTTGESAFACPLGWRCGDAWCADCPRYRDAIPTRLFPRQYAGPESCT